MLKVNFQHLRDSKQGFWLIIDFVMLGLLTINLLLIVLDALFSTAIISNFVQSQMPWLYTLLRGLHQNFLLIDLVFVSVFLTEFCIRWYFAVKEKTYVRWFFFPFIHWYDLLGCIPLGSTRLLRFLRVFSIIYRLHHYRIIDFKETRIFQFLVFYYNVLLEELSDRVVVKVITGIQEDLRADVKLGDKIQSRIIEPRIPALASTFDRFIYNMANSIREDRDNALAKSIRRSVGLALTTHADIIRIQAIPIIGAHISEHLGDTVAEIVVDSLANIVQDARIPSDIEALRESIKTIDLHSKGSFVDFDRQVISLVIDILDLTKEQVNKKAWKEALNQQSS